jgi:hypothetical protein
MDYRIRVWDPLAGRFVAKNLFSGGTRNQCSLALPLAFALATPPQELGVAPGFIFLDEPLSAFDAQCAQASPGRTADRWYYCEAIQSSDPDLPLPYLRSRCIPLSCTHRGGAGD